MEREHALGGGGTEDFSDRGHLGWQHIRKVRQLWPGKLVVKGILDVRDAREDLE